MKLFNEDGEEILLCDQCGCLEVEDLNENLICGCPKPEHVIETDPEIKFKLYSEDKFVSEIFLGVDMTPHMETVNHCSHIIEHKGRNYHVDLLIRHKVRRL